MNFVTSTTGVNENISVSEQTFIDLINNSISESKVVKLASSPRISFLSDQSNVMFVIDVKIKRNVSLKDAIENLKNDIEKNFEILLDFKPNNIRICFVGYY
ncbi:MMB_0454 family protein [Mycoplasmopsis primatum]|uniref:MMB_0454 family protein n=1 Tax=Mycoplasmopsis primatum TaxID=55604 RepID=UPI000495860E|nr:hypothetical protein [Mycoplasmopsis primatum]